MQRSRMMLAFGMAALVLGAVSAQAQTWNIDTPHTAAQFSVRHLGISTVRGAFTKVSGTVQYDAANPTKTVIDATIDAASIDTRVDMRDKDLKSANYFDVEKFPTITFKSKKVEVAGAGKLKVTGDLTIHGVTKETVLDVEGPSDPIKDPWGNPRIGASASTKINRQDFGVSGGGPLIGDDIPITIDMELVQPKAK